MNLLRSTAELADFLFFFLFAAVSIFAMPIGFHHHHGTEPKSSSYPSNANRYVCGGHAAGSAGSSHQTSGAATQASVLRSSGVSADQLQRFNVLLHRPENRECFDCGAKQPRWASTNLGIFFCLRCAGIHRSMGTHISKVKSTNMDAWEESMIQVMEHIGNTRGRVLYEYNMPQSARVTSSTDTLVVERALRAKYEKKTYYNPRFAELYAEFMATPLESVISPRNDDQQVSSKEGGAAQEANTPPRRAPQRSDTSPQPPLHELWAAPVSSPPAGPTGGASSEADNHRHHSFTSVAELFSDSCPAGVGARPHPSAAWGTFTPNCNNNNNANANTGNGGPAGRNSASPNASPNSAANSDWFDSNFGGSNGNPRASGVPSPATPCSQHNAASSSRNNTDDLFQGPGETPRSGRNAGSKDEILYLFASAPVAGAGGQPTGVHGMPNSAHPMAWQPQTVKPYYYPE